MASHESKEDTTETNGLLFGESDLKHVSRWANRKGLECTLPSVYYFDMSQTIRAIYENGVLRPLETLSLAERERVRLTVEPDSPNLGTPSADDGVTDPLLGLRAATGIPDLAENFDDYRFGKRRP